MSGTCGRWSCLVAPLTGELFGAAFGDAMMVAAGSTSASSSLMIVAMKYPRPPKKPTDLEEAFRELKKLRIEVAKAEAAARKMRRSNGHMKTIRDRDNDNAP
jgi:hypothetical protein